MQYLLSTQALEQALPFSATTGIMEFCQRTSGAGYNGMALFPIMRVGYELKVLDQLYRPIELARIKEQIGALIQPYRSEESIKQVLAYTKAHWRQPEAMFQLLASLVLVMGRRKSLRYLLPLAKEISVPTIFYPWHRPLDTSDPWSVVNINGVRWREKHYEEFTSFPERLILVYRGLMQYDFWGPTSPQGIWKIAEQYGYTGIALNPGYLLEMFPSNSEFALFEWQQHIKALIVDAKRLDEEKYRRILTILKEKCSWDGKVIIYRFKQTAQKALEETRSILEPE